MESNIVIATFYHFFPFPDFKEKQPEWLSFCKKHSLKGTILIASEGINSTISGTRENIDKLMGYLKSDHRISGLEWKESYAPYQPFERMKVRLKEEIVRMGVKDLEREHYVGTYIEPKDWDSFISRPDVITIDTRNDYETKIGKFKGSIDPNTKTFRQFPHWVKGNMIEVDKATPIAMYCTGGIRCEKSTAYMRQLGFKNVYHLKGGILKYFEDTENKGKMWDGECFVFDDRVAVNDRLEPTPHTILCDSCGKPMSTDDLRFAPEGSITCPLCATKD